MRLLRTFWARLGFLRSLRFRLTLSYVLFFTVLLVAIGLLFRGTLQLEMDGDTRTTLEEEWAAARGYLHIDSVKSACVYDTSDPEETYIVERMKHVYLLTDAQGKVLESFAHGLPCVMSEIAAEGLELPEDLQWLIARSPAEFADKMIELETNETRNARLSAAGLAYIEGRHSAEAIRAALDGIRQQLGLVQGMKSTLTSIGSNAKEVSAKLDQIRDGIVARIGEAEAELRLSR